jgi:glyoxylase-like metal-dependent hydrolase (beta-lactamase superfamily II)
VPLPLPNDGLRSVNVYLLEDADSLVLIDSGRSSPESVAALESALRLLGYSFGDIRRFLITHVHRDHYTQAIALRRSFGSKIELGRGELPSLRVYATPGRRRLAAQLELLSAHGAAEIADRLRAIGAGTIETHEDWEWPDDWVDADQQVPVGKRMLRALETPGHTRGHVVYVDEQDGLLFAGDHVLPHITPSIGFEAAPVDQPLGNFLASLRRVRLLPDLRLLPAHGPVMRSSHQRIDEILEHHDIRLIDTRKAIEAGAETAVGVAQSLRWTRRQLPLTTLDPFDQMLAVTETAAHLDLLVAQGRLRKKVIAGVYSYFPLGPNSTEAVWPGSSGAASVDKEGGSFTWN